VGATSGRAAGSDPATDKSWRGVQIKNPLLARATALPAAKPSERENTENPTKF